MDIDANGSYEEPSKIGGKFIGWYTDPECTDGNEFDISVLTSDITVYAKYEAVLYSVVFDDNHEDGSELRVNVKYDNTTKTYPSYTVDNLGHTFLG
jgi:hypothetical protein